MTFTNGHINMAECLLHFLHKMSSITSLELALVALSVVFTHKCVPLFVPKFSLTCLFPHCCLIVATKCINRPYLIDACVLSKSTKSLKQLRLTFYNTPLQNICCQGIQSTPSSINFHHLSTPRLYGSQSHLTENRR